MAFMEPEVEFGYFEVLESYNGGMIFPQGVLSTEEILQELNDNSDVILNSIKEAEEAGLYKLVHGWFCRLNAPGYMDCTSWEGPFDNETDALEYLNDTYGSDDVENDN